MLRAGSVAASTARRAASRGTRSLSYKLADWANIDPATWNGSNPHTVQNLGA